MGERWIAAAARWGAADGARLNELPEAVRTAVDRAVDGSTATAGAGERLRAAGLLVDELWSGRRLRATALVSGRLAFACVAAIVAFGLPGMPAGIAPVVGAVLIALAAAGAVGRVRAHLTALRIARAARVRAGARSPRVPSGLRARPVAAYGVLSVAWVLVLAGGAWFAAAAFDGADAAVLISCFAVAIVVAVGDCLLNVLSWLPLGRPAD